MEKKEERASFSCNWHVRAGDGLPLRWERSGKSGFLIWNDDKSLPAICQFTSILQNLHFYISSLKCKFRIWRSKIRLTFRVINTLITSAGRGTRRKISFIIHRRLLFAGLNARFIFTISSGQTGKSFINLRGETPEKNIPVIARGFFFLRRLTQHIPLPPPLGLTFFTLHILPFI